MMTVVNPHIKNQPPPLEFFRSFGNANFDEMCRMVRTKHFNPLFYTNISEMSAELICGLKKT